MSAMKPVAAGPDSGKRQRVVLYRLGSLGDTVVALPCLHAVALAFPDAERVLLTNIPVSAKAAPLEAILGGSGLVHRFMAYPVGTRSFAALRTLRRALRSLDAKTLVYLTPARGRLAAWRDWLYFRLCGFTDIVGVPLSTDQQRNRIDAEGLLERECERLARCLAPLGPIRLDDPGAWRLNLNTDERDAATAALGDAAGAPKIAINMGGKVLRNDWGEAHWRALLTRLRDAFADHALVFVGASEDAVRAATVGALWHGPVANLCGRVSPRVSAAAMEGSRVFIGHDSGPLHLAASVGVPCVGLFGDNNLPRKWHPLGPAHHSIHDMRGVEAIGVERIEAAARAVLAPAEDASPPAQPTVAGP